MHAARFEILQSQCRQHVAGTGAAFLLDLQAHVQHALAEKQFFQHGAQIDGRSAAVRVIVKVDWANKRSIRSPRPRSNGRRNRRLVGSAAGMGFFCVRGKDFAALRRQAPGGLGFQPDEQILGADGIRQFRVP